MKKTFVILITVALLGILAASTAPGQKPTAQTTATSVVAATAKPVVQTPTNSSAPATTGQYKDGHYTGSTSSNRYDNIQVAITITGGKIITIDTPTLQGDSERSQQINGYAIPQLKDQAISSQSSTIDGVSGASYTTEAYASSLQSALDQAKA